MLEFILDPLDIILFQLGASEHIDDRGRDPAGIGSPVDGSGRVADTFVFVTFLRATIRRHLGGAPQHDPTLGAVVAVPQRWFGVSFYRDLIHADTSSDTSPGAESVYVR